MIQLMNSSFLESSSSFAEDNAPLLKSFSNLEAMARSWAIAAGREVLQYIDKPNFHALRTCQILTTYWFSVGDSQRNTMFSGALTPV